MFSGIVEATARVVRAEQKGGLLEIEVERPAFFDDIAIGDSIAHDGVCLTVEKINPQTIQYSLGAETLKITGWTSSTLLHRRLNIERSLKMGDRIHGHLVTGHVDTTARVEKIENLDGSVLFRLRYSPEFASCFWKKGSWAVNGVSLTINDVGSDWAESCLIPETLKRTNLQEIKIGQTVNLEVDMMARALLRYWSLQSPEQMQKMEVKK